jgi:hypothetical protein
MTDAAADDAAAHRRQHALAHALLLEAVDCIAQARELLAADHEPVLSSVAEQLERLASVLAATSSD